LSPLRDAPAKLWFGQFVKCVAVGFDTMVQPATTVSADAGVAVAVATTGVTSATAIANAVPVTRRRRPTITVTPNLCDARCYGWPCRSASGMEPHVLALTSRNGMYRGTGPLCPLSGENDVWISEGHPLARGSHLSHGLGLARC
jgi:hypothetical protein